MRVEILRGVSLVTVIAVLAPSPLHVQAMAGPSDAASQVIDGAPTPEACAEYGFHRPRPATYAQPPAPRALPAPPPPVVAVAPSPPAPAIADESYKVEEVVVTASRLQGHAQTSTLPVEVYGYSSSRKASRAERRAEARLNTERYPHATPNPVKVVEEDPVSTFSIDVDTAAYANVRRFLMEGQRPPRDAVRVEELVNYFDYGYRAPEDPKQPFATFVAVAPSPWSAGKELVHIGVQGFKPPTTSQPPLNLVFLVDTSGSMMSDDRLPLAQKSLNVLIDQLRPLDRVALVAYAGSAGEVLAPTSGREKLKLRCAVNYLEAGGSTAGGAGLSLAYKVALRHFDKQAVNRVILMTDGDFNVGVTDNKSLEDYVSAQRKTGVYLSVYGFGRGNYQDERMQVLAQNGNGIAAYVDSFGEARKLFATDFSKSVFPIADDVKIQIEFNPRQVSEYRLIGYETRMLKREDFNNDAVDAGEVNAGASVTALYEVTPVGGQRWTDPLRYSVDRPRPSKSAEIAQLKIRYKLPGATTSNLIEQPIGPANRYASVSQAPEPTRWAAAVASYGQKLRGDAYLSRDFGWDRVIGLAEAARGDDPTGARGQFLTLARSAQAIEAKPTQMGALER